MKFYCSTILETLLIFFKKKTWRISEFDRRVKESKAKAEEAMKDIPRIENQIKTAEDKTKAAQISLYGAETNASLARDLALEAKRIAEMASKVGSDRSTQFIR